jgi:hypothetical protein
MIVLVNLVRKVAMIFAAVLTAGVLILALRQFRVLAAPTVPLLQTMAQPNGIRFQARLRGDRWFQWRETIEGHPIVLDVKTGYWVYAVPSGNKYAPLLPSKSIVGKQTAPVAPWRPLPPPAGVQKRASSQQVVAPSNSGQHTNPNNSPQLPDLNKEKASRTPSQRKLDSQLVYALQQSRNQHTGSGATTLQHSVKIGSGGQVRVDIDGKVTPELLKRIRQIGGQVINSFPQFGAVRAEVPLAQLETLASLAEVRFIQPAREGITNGIKGQSGSSTSPSVSGARTNPSNK